MAFEKALSLNPSYLEALRQIVAVFIAQGHPDKAVERTRCHVLTTARSAAAYDFLGYLLQAQGKDMEAEQAFKQAIELDNNLFDAYNHLGNLYAKNICMPRLLRNTSWGSKRPNLPAPYGLLGLLYGLQNDHSDLARIIKWHSSSIAKFAVAANNLAWNYAEYGGNLEEAMALVRTAKEQLPDHPEVASYSGLDPLQKARILIGQFPA